MHDTVALVRRPRRTHRACAYCARDLPAEGGVADLRVPLARGGAETRSNVVLACAACHAAKGEMTATEFRDVIRQVAKQRGSSFGEAVDAALAFGGYQEMLELVSALWARPAPRVTALASDEASASTA